MLDHSGGRNVQREPGHIPLPHRQVAVAGVGRHRLAVGGVLQLVVGLVQNHLHLAGGRRLSSGIVELQLCHPDDLLLAGGNLTVRVSEHRDVTETRRGILTNIKIDSLDLQPLGNPSFTCWNLVKLCKQVQYDCQ